MQIKCAPLNLSMFRFAQIRTGPLNILCIHRWRVAPKKPSTEFERQTPS
jgi:hypothetical protein